VVRDRNRNKDTKESYRLGNSKCVIEEYQCRIFHIARRGWLAPRVRTGIITQSTDGEVVRNILSTVNEQTCRGLAEG